MGKYGSAVNAKRRLKELENAFENEVGWKFEREAVLGDNTIWVTYPPDMFTNREDVYCYIRKNSIEYRRKIREAEAE